MQLSSHKLVISSRAVLRISQYKHVKNHRRFLNQHLKTPFSTSFPHHSAPFVAAPPCPWSSASRPLTEGCPLPASSLAGYPAVSPAPSRPPRVSTAPQLGFLGSNTTERAAPNGLSLSSAPSFRHPGIPERMRHLRHRHTWAEARVSEQLPAQERRKPLS